MRRPIPLGRRRLDWILLAFFALNLFFITYIVDIEQLTIANPAHFRYPVWPPRFFVDMVHSYGSRYDPLLMARPAFWRMGIWIDVIWNGPFYASEGFVERGPVDDFLRAHGLPPEPPVMGRFGVRVLMVRSL